MALVCSPCVAQSSPACEQAEVHRSSSSTAPGLAEGEERHRREKESRMQRGWNALEISGNKDNWDNSILNNTPVKSHVYFVHSFFSKPNNKEHLLAHCNYGGNNLSAVICRDNVMGCQFHPEKSGPIGLNILRAFLTL